MRFLKGDNVVRLERRQWIQEALSYSTTRHEGLLQEYGLTYPFPVGAGVLQVFVKHRVANVDVELQEEHNLRDYHMHLRAFVRHLLILVHQAGPTAIQGTQVSQANKS